MADAMASLPRFLKVLLGAALVVVVVGLRIGLAIERVHADRAPRVDPPAGFTGDVSQPPAQGVWRATGTYTSVKGFSGRQEGESIVRRWWIRRRCAADACSFVLTREMSNLPRQSGRLRLRDDGWHATFPTIVLPCNGADVTWKQHTQFVLRFTRGGTAVEGHEVHHAYANRCGYGVSRVDWTAQRATGSAAARNDGPVDADMGPVNGISEQAMARSVQQAVQMNIDVVERQLADVIGHEVELRPRATDCRSRENTASRRGSAFFCVVATVQTRPPAGALNLGVLVTHIEGRCWRGVENGYATASDTRLRRYDADVLERNLSLRPLRGCA